MTQAGANAGSANNTKPKNSSGVDAPKETLAQQPTQAFVLAEALEAIKNGTYKDYFMHHDLSSLDMAQIQELKSHASQHNDAFAKSVVFYKNENGNSEERDWEDVRNALIYYQKEDLETLRKKTEAKAQELDVNPAVISEVGDEQIKEWLQELQGLDNANPEEKLLKSEDIFKKIAKYINEMPLCPSRKEFKTQEEYIVARDAFREAHKGKAYREPAPESVYKAGAEGTPPRKVYDIDFGESEKGKLQGTMYIPRDDGKQDIITFDKDGKPTAFLRADPKEGTALSEKTLGYLLEQSRGIEEGVGRNADSKSLAAAAALSASKDTEAQSLDAPDAPGWGELGGGGVARSPLKAGMTGEVDEAMPKAADTTEEMKAAMAEQTAGHDKALEGLVASARDSSLVADGARTLSDALHEEPDGSAASLATHREKEPDTIEPDERAKRPSAVVGRDGAEAAFERSSLIDALDLDKPKVLDQGEIDAKKRAMAALDLHNFNSGENAEDAGANCPQNTAEEKEKQARERAFSGDQAGPTAADTPDSVAKQVAEMVREEDASKEIGHSASRPTAIDTPPEVHAAAERGAAGHTTHYQVSLDGKVLSRNVPPEVEKVVEPIKTGLENAAAAPLAAPAPAKELGKEQGPALPQASPAQPAAPAKSPDNGRVSPTDGMKRPPVKNAETKSELQKSASRESKDVRM